MSRYRGPVSRLCRREGMKLFLKGAKCYTKKCPFERRGTPPGQHGVRRRKMSEVRRPAAREAEDAARLHGQRAPVQALLRHRGVAPGRDRREPPAPARDAPRQRRLPDGLRQQPRPGAPAGRPRPLLGQRPRDGHPLVPRQARAIASRSARAAARASTSRSVKDALAGAPRARLGRSSMPTKLAGTVTAMPRRDQMPLELNEQLVVEYYSR